MHDEVLELLDAIQTNRSLEVRLEIHENGRYAPLALDLSGLHAVLFAGVRQSLDMHMPPTLSEVTKRLLMT